MFAFLYIEEIFSNQKLDICNLSVYFKMEIGFRLQHSYQIRKSPNVTFSSKMMSQFLIRYRKKTYSAAIDMNISSHLASIVNQQREKWINKHFTFIQTKSR